MNGAVTGHIHPTASTTNRVITGSIPSIVPNLLTMNGAVTGHPTASTANASIASNPLTMNGAVTGHTHPAASTAHGVITGPNPPPASNPLTINGALTGYVPPTAVMVPIANGATATHAANGTTHITPLIFTPLTSLTGSNHGLPYELTDLLVSFKECKGIFKCIRDLQNDKFCQLAIVSLNSPMREVLNVSPSDEIAYPDTHMAGTLKFERNDEVLVFNITWIVDHMVEFTLEASTLQDPLW